MKNVIFTLLLVFGQMSAQFKLNTNPENPSRMPDWRTEVGIVLAKNSPTIIISGANNKQSTNFLPAGVLVIVDKDTHIAKWIAICGNKVIKPTNWKPEGKIISFVTQGNYQTACEEMLFRLDNIQEGVEELLRRPNLSITELRMILKEEALKKSSNNNCWTAGKTATTILGTGIGAVAGGYLFQKERIKIIPGIRLQSGDGTIIFGPEKVRVEKKFNVGAAVACGLVSGVITYLLNEFVF
jgi:hypothetical protein